MMFEDVLSVSGGRTYQQNAIISTNSMTDMNRTTFNIRFAHADVCVCAPNHYKFIRNGCAVV